MNDEREETDLPNGHAPIHQLPPFLARRLQKGEGEELAEALHYALGRDDWGAANEDERTEMLDATDALMAKGVRLRRQAPITDAMVEAAAQSIYGGTPVGWTTLAGGWQNEYRRQARAALEAAEAVR